MEKWITQGNLQILPEQESRIIAPLLFNKPKKKSYAQSGARLLSLMYVHDFLQGVSHQTRNKKTMVLSNETVYLKKRQFLLKAEVPILYTTKTSTAGVKSMHSRPGLLNFHFVVIDLRYFQILQDTAYHAALLQRCKNTSKKRPPEALNFSFKLFAHFSQLLKFTRFVLLKKQQQIQTKYFKIYDSLKGEPNTVHLLSVQHLKILIPCIFLLHLWFEPI